MYNLRNDILDIVKNKVKGKIWDMIGGAATSHVWHYIHDKSRVYRWDMFDGFIIKKTKLNLHNW